MEEVRRTWGNAYKPLLAQFIVRECIKARPRRPSTTRDLCNLANHFDVQFMQMYSKDVKPQPHTTLNIMKYLGDLITLTEVEGQRLSAHQVGGKGQPWTFVESSQATLCALGVLECTPSTSGFFQPTVDEQAQIIAFIGGVGSGKTSATRTAAQQANDQGIDVFGVNCASGNLKEAAEAQGNWAFDKASIVQVNSFEEYIANKESINEWQKEIGALAVLHIDDDVGCLLPQSTGQGIQEQRKIINQFYAGVRMPVNHHLVNVHTARQVQSMIPHISSLFIGSGGGKGLLGHLQADPASIEEAHVKGIENLQTGLADDFAVCKMSKTVQREAAVALHAGHEQMRQEAIATKLQKGADAIILTGPNRMRPVKIDGVGCKNGTWMYHVMSTSRLALTRSTYRRDELHSGFTGNIFVKIPAVNKEFYVVRRAEAGSGLGPDTVPDSKWFVPPPPPTPVEYKLGDFQGFGQSAVAEPTDDEDIDWEDGPVRYHHSHCLSLHN